MFGWLRTSPAAAVVPDELSTWEIEAPRSVLASVLSRASEQLLARARREHPARPVAVALLFYTAGYRWDASGQAGDAAQLLVSLFQEAGADFAALPWDRLVHVALTLQICDPVPFWRRLFARRSDGGRQPAAP